ncbi:hypothetical protein [Streptomyces sp. NPDC001415]
MDGHSYAVLIAGVAVTVASLDVIRLYRKLPKRPADDAGSAVAEPSDIDRPVRDAAPTVVPDETVPPDSQTAAAERNFGLVIVYHAAFVAFALVVAGLYWSAEDDQHWTQDKVVHETEKIAAGIESGGQAPSADATPGEGSFQTLVDTAVRGIVKDYGLGLKDEAATPPRAPWTVTSSPAPPSTIGRGRRSPPSTGPVSSSPQQAPSRTACRQVPVSAALFTATRSKPRLRPAGADTRGCPPSPGPVT